MELAAELGYNADMNTTCSQRLAVLDRLLDPVRRCLTPEVARGLVDLRADTELQQLLDELAEKNAEGTITPEEREGVRSLGGRWQPDCGAPGQGADGI